MSPTSGYSGTPLVKKLGIKPGNRVLTFGRPDHYLDLLVDLPDDVTLLQEDDEAEHEIEFIHVFAVEEHVLDVHFRRLKERMHLDGMIWISWPKKASKVPTDLSDAVVRSMGLSIGLVDTKVCAVDAVWSGLKFMYRKEDRKRLRKERA